MVAPESSEKEGNQQTSDLNIKGGINREEVSEGPVFLIKPTRGFAYLAIKELWEYRELLYFLAWRDVKVRYKQTALGVLWVILQPLATVAILSLVFGRLLKVPSGEVPYPLFLLSALLPWNYFSSTLSRCSSSLVGSANLITKVYFPRLVIPLSAAFSGMVDFFVALSVVVAMLLYYGILPGSGVLLLPGFLIMALLAAVGFGLLLAALNVRFRDVNYLVPFLLQIWMYGTPVIYGSNLIPERFRWILVLNPMTGVVEGFRWALLGGHLSDMGHLEWSFFVSIVIVLVVVVSGMLFFRSTERTFADLI